MTIGKGFFGTPVAVVAASSHTLIVTAALCAAGAVVGNGIFGTIGYTGAGRENYIIHSLVTPDPGSDVGSIAPGSAGGFPVVGVINAKVGSPLVSYLIFQGTFNIAGATVTYPNNVGGNSTTNLNAGTLTTNLGLGAGFSVYQMSSIFGTLNDFVNPLSLLFNF